MVMVWTRHTKFSIRCAAVLWQLFVLGGASRGYAQRPQDEQQKCAQAFEAAQEMRLANAFMAARAQLQVCSQPICRDFMRDACSDWLKDGDSKIATVTFDVLRGERPVTEVRVLDNGVPLVVKLDGEPVEVDPGEHVIEVEISDTAPMKRRVVLQP